MSSVRLSPKPGKGCYDTGRDQLCCQYAAWQENRKQNQGVAEQLQLKLVSFQMQETMTKNSVCLLVAFFIKIGQINFKIRRPWSILC
jgi:hypothetical protein